MLFFGCKAKNQPLEAWNSAPSTTQKAFKEAGFHGSITLTHQALSNVGNSGPRHPEKA
jgi:hypothetical protein